jgi:hypothetical protein
MEVLYTPKPPKPPETPRLQSLRLPELPLRKSASIVTLRLYRPRTPPRQVVEVLYV